MREIKFKVWNDLDKIWVKEAGMSDLVGINLNIHAPLMIFLQYTGLKDKNGVEIYEGDIVSIQMWNGNDYEPELGSINYDDEAGGFKWLSGDPSDRNNYWLGVSVKKREVIGNIWENPDLLGLDK